MFVGAEAVVENGGTVNVVSHARVQWRSWRSAIIVAGVIINVNVVLLLVVAHSSDWHIPDRDRGVGAQGALLRRRGIVQVRANIPAGSA